MLKLLLVDPSDEWLEKMQKDLESEQYSVDVASSGKVAQSKIYSQKEKGGYFAIVLHMFVENYSGIEVMKYIKSNHPAQFVILHYESEEQLHKAEIRADLLPKLGASEIYCGPLELDTLKRLLEGQQGIGQMMSRMTKREGASEEVQVDLSDNQFTAIPIDEFLSGQGVLFDIFVRIGEGRYIKILHAGDAFTKERVLKYKNEKQVTHLHFKTSDRLKYIRFCNLLGEKMLTSSVPIATKMTLIKNVSEKFVEELFAGEIKPQVLEQGKKISEHVYRMIEQEKSLYKELRALHDIDPSQFSKSYLVGLFSSACANQFEWKSPGITQTVTTASLLHDIGLTRISESLITKKYSEMLPEEKKEYEQHPVFGSEIVKENRFLTNSLIQIVLQHHEASDGTGYPNGLKDASMNTLAKIIRLADDFVDDMMAGGKPVEIMRTILMSRDRSIHYNGRVLEKFMNVFLDPDKVKKDVIVISKSKLVPGHKETK